MSNNQKTNAAVVFGIFGTLVLLFAGFGIGGGGQLRRAQAANLPASEVLTYLSADDVAMLLEDIGNASALAAMANDAEKRNEILKQIKELLLVAREAEAVGLAEDADVRDNFEISEMQTLTFAFEKRLNADRLRADESFSPLDNLGLSIADHDLSVFWQNSENESKFERLLKSAERQQLNGVALTAEQREAFREQYAKLAISAQRARLAGLEYERRIWVQIQIRKAQVLAQAYAQKYQQTLEPTADEIAAYIAEHAELNPRRIRERAEMILQRARAGEDFAWLANEYSNDPGSWDKGGLYENVKKGMFVPEFEAAALRLEAGQIGDIVESKYGFHVIQLVSKTDQNYTVRHILINGITRDKTPGDFNRIGFAERAKQAAQKLKTERFFAHLEQRHSIVLPHAEELKIKAPSTPNIEGEPCEDCGTGDAGGEPPAEPSDEIEVSTKPNKIPEPTPTPIN